MHGFADAPGLYLQPCFQMALFEQIAKTKRTNARLQLLQQNREVAQAVAAVDARGVQHEHEHARALDVAEEQVAQPAVRVRALYDARQIRHRQRLRVLKPSGIKKYERRDEGGGGAVQGGALHNAEVGRQRGEGKRCHLRLGVADGCQ